jgi:endonuclease-3
MDKERAIRQLKEFEKLGKNPEELRLAAESWKNDFQILVSIILSARTRDETTTVVAEKIFAKYPTAEKLASVNISEIMNILKPVNFYKNKSKSILACAKTLVSEYKGNVPHDFDKLIELPGVGRKTANVFLAEQGQDSIGIDTHVSYLSNKMGWTKSTNQKQVEEDLKKIFPQEYWGRLNDTLVRFGKTHTSRKKKDLLVSQIKKIK